MCISVKNMCNREIGLVMKNLFFGAEGLVNGLTRLPVLGIMVKL